MEWVYNQEIKSENGVMEMTAKSEKVYKRILSLDGERGAYSYVSLS